MKNLLLLCCLLGLITACSNCRQAGRLSVGMTKEEVLKVMDREADRFSGIKNTQVLYYSCRGKDPDLIIRFVDGKIDAYGKAGDFDLTKEPRALINIKTDSSEKKEVIIKHEETKSKK